VEAASATELVREEDLRTAELGFHRFLRRKRFSEHFIAEYGADLLAQAQREYADWLASGRVADNPIGWLINCAWRRTQNLLDAQRRKPKDVSIDEALHLADELTPTPEQQAIDHELHERLQNAMEHLDAKERKLLELTYFEGFSIREAGRTLNMSKSSADRHHGAALERLRALLPDDLGALEAETGLAAWVSIAAEKPKPSAWHAGLDAGLDTVREGVAVASHRLSELWRKIYPAADPSNTTATSGALRTAGACGAAAVACLASGVVGPGVGAVDLIERQPKAENVARAPKPAGVATSTAPVSPTPAATAAPAPTSTAQRSTAKSAKRDAKPQPRGGQDTPAAATTSQTPPPEFGIEGGSGSTSTSATPTTSDSSTSTSGTSPPSASATRPNTSQNSGTSSEEFGF
jgi:RNA polymerase sigma factor (sigma-70 family)